MRCCNSKWVFHTAFPICVHVKNATRTRDVFRSDPESPRTFNTLILSRHANLHLRYLFMRSSFNRTTPFPSPLPPSYFFNLESEIHAYVVRFARHMNRGRNKSEKIIIVITGLGICIRIENIHNVPAIESRLLDMLTHFVNPTCGKNCT